MAYEITGHLIHKLTQTTGQGQKGPWVKQEFVIETMDKDYPKKVCLTAWGKATDYLSGLKKNHVIKCSFSAESREHNQKWYTELRAFKIESVDESPVGAPRSKPPVQQRTERTFSQEDNPHQYDDSEDGLPF